MYLTISRPDISYTVHILSQHMAHPKAVHLQAIFKLLKYLKGTCDQGILFSSTGPLILKACCDADWGSCQTTRKSVTGYFVSLGSSLIS